MTTPTKAGEVVTAGQLATRRAVAAGEWTNREAELLRDVLAPGLAVDDLRVFAKVCQVTGLDPFRKEIYAWKDGRRLAIHIGINGWRRIAAKGGEYAGQGPIQWCGADGQWRDVWLEDEPPAAARAAIHRVGAPEPVVAVVTWREFERTKERTGARGPTVWDEKGAHMLGIRAESHALQRACPLAFEEFQRTVQELPELRVEVVDDEEIEAEAPALPEGAVDDEPDEDDAAAAADDEGAAADEEDLAAAEGADAAAWNELTEAMKGKVAASHIAAITGTFDQEHVLAWLRENEATVDQLVSRAVDAKEAART